ncbi:hypothetical protein JXB31_00845 [Candidatus Woesearchaeota archaeon]|nr:hypothetical protein [Candidatus Woesearchaeota archaeon]
MMATIIDKKKDEQLTARSIEVIKDCCRPNGAIIAANTEHGSYPKDVQSYHYVWPRDAAYVCLALSYIGEFDAQARFFDWLSYRAEGMEKGMIFQNYHLNGRKRWTSYQPDQTGIILVALANLIKSGHQKDNHIALARKLADTIAADWEKNHFRHITQNLWENEFAYPKLEQCFAYSAAIVATGLAHISPLISRDYSHVCKEMRMTAESAYSAHEGYHIRKTGIVADKRPDSSNLGLVWPTGVVGNCGAVDPIIKRLWTKNGLMRFEFDNYDSFRYEGTNAFRGAGAWPLLNFWAAIAYKKTGNDDKAAGFYSQGMMCADEKGCLPEQVFENSIQSSVSPLAWSHAMQIIARNTLEGHDMIRTT